MGYLKTNVGHLDVAAGVAGLIKTVLSLEHQQMPPSLNFERPNPKIDFENSPFFVNTKLTEWKNDNGPRRAGVNAFGIGGTNAHVIVRRTAPRKLGFAQAVAPFAHLREIIRSARRCDRAARRHFRGTTPNSTSPT